MLNEIRTFGLAIALGLASAGAPAAEITGAGASFPAPVYAQWAEEYKAATGNALNYQAIGSGGGIKQIKVKTVDFGATDAPLDGKQLDRGGLVQFPAIIGGVVLVANVGAEPGALTLSGPVVAAIYKGEIKNWNDARVAALNPGLSLPADPITVVYRSDSSGTTAVFTEYCAATDPSFESAVGAGKTVKWPTGIGGKGNAGVAANVMKLKNSIGYVEYAYAKQNRLAHAAMINAAGNRVQPGADTFSAAADGANWKAQPGFGISLNDQAAPQAWPITAASFILMHAKVDDAARATEVLRFFDWAFAKGADAARALDYVPLPDSTIALVRDAWQAIQGPDGKPLKP
ncbi:MAG: phosphate ABC transporter substrate-binding protein PstS [Burkholderiaceae bacterium]